MTARCIVTGGTGAVGAAVVRALCARGASVGLTFHRAEDLARSLVDELGVAARRLDLLRPADVGRVARELADELGGVDAFVHAAGLASTQDPPTHDRLEDVDPDGFDRLMGVGVRGALLCVQALAPRFEGGGNVVLLGSVDGRKPVPTPVPYATSKAALTGMARALAKELGPRDIRVNVVAPGILDAGSSSVLQPSLREQYLEHSALRRFGRVEEAAALVVSLALDNTYLTAQTVVIDGGL